MKSPAQSVCLVILVAIMVEANMFMTGGLGPTKVATPEIQSYCREVKKEVKNVLGIDFHKYDAVAYRSQIVAGTNYFVKIHIGGDNYIVIRIYKALPYSNGPALSLAGVQVGATKDSPIKHFG